MLEQLKEELKDAMRSKDNNRRDTIRLLMAEFKKARIAKGEDLTEADNMTVLTREAKKRREAIEAFRKVGDELGVLEAS